MSKKNFTPITNFTFDAVTEAIELAILQNNTMAIDSFIREDLNCLVQTRNGKTPIYAALENIFEKNIRLETDERQALYDNVVVTLKHIFHQLDIRLGFDETAMKQLVDKACNHKPRSSRILNWRATVRDMLEEYVRIDILSPTYEESYPDLHRLVEVYDLKSGRVPEKRVLWPQPKLHNDSIKGR